MRKTDWRVPIATLEDLWDNCYAIEILEGLHYANGLNYVPKGAVLFPQVSENYDAVAIFEDADRRATVMNIQMSFDTARETRAKERTHPLTIYPTKKVNRKKGRNMDKKNANKIVRDGIEFNDDTFAELIVQICKTTYQEAEAYLKQDGDIYSAVFSLVINAGAEVVATMIIKYKKQSVRIASAGMVREFLQMTIKRDDARRKELVMEYLGMLAR